MSQENQTEQQGSGQGLAELAGKYLTFCLANEHYGAEILKVVEIIKLMEITEVPRTPHYVRGVINLRGKVIPVVNLRAKFGMETIDDTDETCIIVVSIGDEDAQMGILVDNVSEVLDIKPDEIEPSPKFGGSIETDFIQGMAKVNKQVVILLDIGTVLQGVEAKALAGSF